MTAVTFDSLGYFQKLKAAGVPEAQAQVQADAMREALEKYDESSRKELATKGDLADTKHEILKWALGIALAQTAVIVAVIGAAIALVVK